MSNNVNICEISEEAKSSLRQFRFSKIQDTCALILKVDREKHEIIVDEKLDNTTIDDIKDNLPSHQPRYVFLSYKLEHRDGRVSYPLCFVFFTPRDSHAELQMMYAGSKISLQRCAEMSRAYEIRELDDFTDEWLEEKLGS